MTLPKESGDNLVKVKIFGKEYSIRSDDEDRVLRVASFLNEQLDIIKNNSPVLNVIDQSIMTAFKIASDYIDVLEKLESLQNIVEVESEALTTKIDSSL